MFKDVVGEVAEKGQLAAIDQLGISSLTFIPNDLSYYSLGLARNIFSNKECYVSLPDVAVYRIQTQMKTNIT